MSQPLQPPCATVTGTYDQSKRHASRNTDAGHQALCPTLTAMTLLPPNGFATIPEGALEVALAKTWDALNPELAIPRLRRYYDPTGDYAGATFVDAQPVIPDEFTAADLFALTLLSVDAPKPRVTRNFLDPGTRQDELTQLLRSAHLAGNQDLAHADDDTLLAMRQLYRTVKSTLGTNPWVTASKLCA